jgi:3-(3-hydroxy-phenyl)propionate hydroxylase
MASHLVTQVDVAIVGCGPAGVVLAALLGQAGLRVHICDRLPGVYEIPRAISLDHEILRVFQRKHLQLETIGRL